MLYMPKRKFDLFNDMFDGFFQMEPVNHENIMRTDIHEKDGYYTLDIEMPGYTKEDINIDIASGYLSVNAKHNFTNEEKDEKGHVIRSERSFGSCSRSYYVGDSIKGNDIKAKFDNGILKISLPSEKQKQIETKETIMIE